MADFIRRFFLFIIMNLGKHSVYIYEQYYLHMQAEDLHPQLICSLGAFHLLLLYVPMNFAVCRSQHHSIPFLSLHFS